MRIAQNFINILFIYYKKSIKCDINFKFIHSSFPQIWITIQWRERERGGRKEERDGARVFKSILRMRALWLNEEERNNKRTKWNDPETVKWSLLYSFSSSSSSTVFRPNKNKEVRKYRLCSCNLKNCWKSFLFIHLFYLLHGSMDNIAMQSIESVCVPIDIVIYKTLGKSPT